MAEGQLPDWTTEMDEEILEMLNTEMVLTPSVIAENIDRSQGAVARRLNALEAGGLVKKISRGKYQITAEALEMCEGGFEMISDDESDFEIAVRNRDEMLEEEGRTELTQEEYSIGLLGMIREEIEDRDDPIDYMDAVEEGIKKAEKYYKVVEN